MSAFIKYYVIAGYDLTKYKTDKFDNWRWTSENDDYLSYKNKDKIKLFDLYDHMNGKELYCRKLYLGYILACGDEYEFDTTKIPLVKPIAHINEVDDALSKLEQIGIIKSDDNVLLNDILEYQIIVFREIN